MGDRRVLLGTSAVLVGLGSALISGTAVAGAETGDAETSSADKATAGESRTAPGPRRAANRVKTAQPAAATDATPTVRTPATGRDERPAKRATRVPDRNTAPDAPEPIATPAVEVPAAAVAEASPSIPAADTAPAAPAEPAAAVVTEVASAPIAPIASAAPKPAPARAAALSSLVTGLGGLPAGGLVAAAPALAAFTGQRSSAAPAAVIGTPVVAAAPPDPSPLALLAADPTLPGYSNGVTGVQTGHSRLAIPGAFIGPTVAADWYFPTQADGSIDAQGVIWLQHGFGATNTFYSALATDLAIKTNSIVVAPTLSSIPLTISGGCLVCATSQEAAAAVFLDPERTALIDSALAAGFTGDTDQLKGKFALSGHSAGGGFATATAADYINEGSDAQDANLIGVVMFDGVSNGTGDGSFTEEVNTLIAAGTPIYTIAAPAQAWNAFGATTNALAEATDGLFSGVVLTNGSHVDSMLGVNPIFDLVLQLVTGRVPAGNTAATYTLSTGWINDMYAGNTPQTAEYGFYAGANEAIIMGPTAALALPTPIANQLSFGDKVLTTVIDAIGSLFGFSILPTPYNEGDNGLSSVVVPPLSNGVTGVRTGTADLDMPVGPNGYAAPATWYFPTQADGSVAPNGVIWLQHGFLGFNEWYADMASALAQETNSIVVAPTIFWFDNPFCPGCYLGSPEMRVAAASMLQGDRSALNVSANAAGFQGVLPEKIILTGHSAGGNFATSVASLLVGTPQEDNLLGVVMFDGVSRPPTFTNQLNNLNDAQKPVYQISAPPQDWNAWDIATETMTAEFPFRFNGLQIINGSHTDVIDGPSLFADLAEILSAIIVRPSPPGAKMAVRTLATGWVNDIYAGNTTYASVPGPLYGTYMPNGKGPLEYGGGGEFITMGQATASTLPAPPPVAIPEYSGTWFEQGSVPQFFSIGLVNTSATYTPQLDGSIKVENSGNYFFNNGPQSSITGSAVPVNASNTRLNVGFFFGEPNSDEPGNYWILETGPVVDGKYSYAIVSDPSLFSGYILTREKVITDDAYDELRARAQLLGIRGPILRTQQFPESGSGASLPGPAEVPAGVAV